MNHNETMTLEELLNSATLGKWVADDNEGFGANKIWAGHAPSGASPTGTFVAEVVGDSSESDANAELICRLKNAAPAILLALNWFESEAEGRYNGGNPLPVPHGTSQYYWSVFVDAQRDALAALNGKRAIK